MIRVRELMAYGAIDCRPRLLEMMLNVRLVRQVQIVNGSRQRRAAQPEGAVIYAE